MTSTNAVVRGLLSVVGTIARGFLLGLGFSIAVACVYFVVLEANFNHRQTVSTDIRTPASTQPSDTVDFTRPTAATVKDIVLSDVEETRHGGITAIIGSATNNGKVLARGITIEANLFNHGKFVDQYSTYISGGVEPGELKHFKISCGCKDSPAAPHDSFKLEVTGGF
jgi:hypothetical protein